MPLLVHLLFVQAPAVHGGCLSSLECTARASMSCRMHGAGGEVPPGKKPRALSCSVILPAVCGNCRSVDMKVVLSFGLVSQSLLDVLFQGGV